MNLSDERRRLAASILKQKFANSHGFQHHHLESDDAGDQSSGEFIDSVQHQQQVTAAPANRVGRHMDMSPVFRPSKQQKPQTSSSHFDQHQYLLNTHNANHHQHQHQQRYYNNNNNNNNSTNNLNSNNRHSLNPVIESESGECHFGEGRRAQHDYQPRHQRRSGRNAKTNKGHDDKTLVGEVHHENHVAAGGGGGGNSHHGELVNQVKRRLSLPNDTPIPNSFLVKHRTRLNEMRDDPTRPLSRIDRRQSLFAIGFGKLATYSKLHVLGAGTYSIVYKGASRLQPNKLVALKEIHLERDEGAPFTAIREVSLLKQLKHCNIITLHDIIYTSKTLTLVFEYVDRDLSRYMDECDHRINLANVKLFMFQLLRALKYCHDRKILHRDIKPQNILISASGELKLADFGLARAKSFPTKTYTDEVVTLWYRPPDVLLGNVNYGTCIDMWGVGCIFFEMAAGFTLFLGTDPKKQVGCIFEIIGTPDQDSWPSIKSDLRHHGIDIPHYPGRSLASMAPRLDEDGIGLLGMFLNCNPRQRIASSQALHHKYFNSFPPEIFDLHDLASVFSLPTVKLSKELASNNSSQHLHNIHV